MTPLPKSPYRLTDLKEVGHISLYRGFFQYTEFTVLRIWHIANSVVRWSASGLLLAAGLFRMMQVQLRSFDTPNQTIV